MIESFCNSFYLLSYSVFISILVVLQKNVVLRLSRPFGGFGSRFGLVLLVLQIESVNGGDEDGAKTGDVLPVQLFREEHEGDDMDTSGACHNWLWKPCVDGKPALHPNIFRDYCSLRLGLGLIGDGRQNSSAGCAMARCIAMNSSPMPAIVLKFSVARA